MSRAVAMTAPPEAAGRAFWRGRLLLALLFLLALPLLTPRIRGADEIEGFAYLRSLVFDRDLDFENEYRHFYERDPEGLTGFKDTFLERREPLTGRHLNFAPLGSAVLWAPFYLLAHGGVLVARALGVHVIPDGFSPPYVTAVAWSSALYGLLGLLLTHDALRRFGRLSEPAASWSVAALWLATPVLYYMTVAAAFSHAPALFAVSLLLWLSLGAAPGGSVGQWTLVGAAGGLAGLVREQDLLFLVVPAGLLLAGAHRDGLVRPAVRLFAMAGTAALAFAPQLFAYRALNGTFGPSPLVRRKMTYTSPHFVQALLDPGHGLLLWSPILLLAVAGLVLLVWQRRDLIAWLLALAFLLQAWINGSVESWSQAGAFGARRFLSATPILAWGLAAILAALLPRWGRTATAALLAAFVWWNLSLMVQFGLRLMDRQRLEWPRVAKSQVTEVPRHLGCAAWLFFTDRERLVRERRGREDR